MTIDEDVLDRIEGIFAYDTGSIGSGISDPAFKQRLLDGGDIDPFPYLSRIAKDMLNSDQGYTIEDVKSLIDWAAEHIEYEI